MGMPIRLYPKTFPEQPGPCRQGRNFTPQSGGDRGWKHIWQARRAQAYNGGLGAEPPAGSRGRAPGGGSGGRSPLKLKGFGKTTSKSMQGLVSYFADKKQV